MVSNARKLKIYATFSGEEAQWVLESKILQQSKNNNNSIPDFLTLIDPIPLEETKPYAVGLIGIKSR